MLYICFVLHWTFLCDKCRMCSSNTSCTKFICQQAPPDSSLFVWPWKTNTWKKLLVHLQYQCFLVSTKVERINITLKLITKNNNTSSFEINIIVIQFAAVWNRKLSTKNGTLHDFFFGPAWIQSWSIWSWNNYSCRKLFVLLSYKISPLSKKGC